MTGPGRPGPYWPGRGPAGRNGPGRGGAVAGPPLDGAPLMGMPLIGAPVVGPPLMGTPLMGAFVTDGGRNAPAPGRPAGIELDQAALGDVCSAPSATTTCGSSSTTGGAPVLRCRSVAISGVRDAPPTRNQPATCSDGTRAS